MEVDLPGSEHGSPPEVNTEVDPLPEVNTWKWTPLEVNMEVDPPPRSGCRRGGGRGPAEKYCWASGQFALEKRLPCKEEILSFYLLYN